MAVAGRAAASPPAVLETADRGSAGGSKRGRTSFTVSRRIEHPAELLLRRFNQLWSPRFERHNTVRVLTLFLAQIPAQSRQIMIEPRRQFLACSPCFFYDWIFPHCIHRSVSSCGVQITGGS
jgi:hypothetical protein